MGNIIVGDNGTGFYSERTNELIFLDVRRILRASWFHHSLAHPQMTLDFLVLGAWACRERSL
jgi:hypothetical protein|eukprot:COSAG02_NODE_611_length_19555_cov_34.449270_9_plen_62_part_00